MLSLKGYLVRWLDIKEPLESKDFTDDIASLNKRVERIEDVVKPAYEYECANCLKKFTKYPFGGGYYKEHDGSLLHNATCLDEWQEKRNNG